MVRGVSKTKVQTPTVQQSASPTTVQKETKTSSIPTPAQAQSQVTQQKPANKAAMKSEHKLGGQLKSAQLQQQLKNTSGGARSGLTGEFGKPELSTSTRLKGGKSGLTGEFRKPQLPGVYQIATGRKAQSTTNNVQLPGVYEVAAGQKAQAPSNKVQLPGVYEIAGGSTQEPQKAGAKRNKMDFSKGPDFKTRRNLKLGDKGSAVKNLQMKLRQWLKANDIVLLLDVRADGNFDKATQDALKEFQHRNEFGGTGVYDRKTAIHLKLETNKVWNALDSSTQNVVKPGGTVDQIKNNVLPLLNNPRFRALSEDTKLWLLNTAATDRPNGKEMKALVRLLSNRIFQAVSPKAQEEMILAARKLAVSPQKTK